LTVRRSDATSAPGYGHGQRLVRGAAAREMARLAGPWPVNCGSLNWRRGRDSNPRYGCPYAAFRVRCIQPLCHLSAMRGSKRRRPYLTAAECRDKAAHPRTRAGTGRRPPSAQSSLPILRTRAHARDWKHDRTQRGAANPALVLCRRTEMHTACVGLPRPAKSRHGRGRFIFWLPRMTATSARSILLDPVF
jgi:hypothetical protein